MRAERREREPRAVEGTQVELIRLLVILAGIGQGPPPSRPAWAADRPYSESASQIVSPSVVATWMQRIEKEIGRLELLVLWRGAPGWFLAGQGHRSSGGGSPDAWSASVEYAGIPLSVSFNRTTRVAVVQSRTMTLPADVNVLLVDGVDGPDGTLTVTTAFVDPAMPASGNPMPPLLRRSDRLVEFLQCGLNVPQASAQRMIDMLCAQVRSAR